MSLDVRNLQRYGRGDRAAQLAPDDSQRPPAQRDVVALCAGNSAETVGLRAKAIAYSDQVWLHVAGLNNDRLPPRPLPVRRADGTSGVLALTERLILDGEHPRERVQDDPLLAARYADLLRGVPVFETYPRAGAGGHGLPVISALDMDLHLDQILGWIRRHLALLHDTPTTNTGASDLQQLVQRAQRRTDTPRERRVLVIGGASGAMGNAAHHLLPPLIRYVLAEQGVTNYQLWGVLLGPRAFTGLTPYVRQNARALLEALEYMSRHGMHRAYSPEVVVRAQQPPYDRVFILDDPSIPAAGTTATEAELERFFDRAALSVATLLRDSTWATVASHIANDDGVPREDGQLRYLHTVQTALLAADRPRLHAMLTAALASEVANRFLTRFAA